VVLCDDNPRGEDSQAILANIAAGMVGRATANIIPDRREAIFALLDRGQPGDTVLLAGKGSEPYQEVRGVKTPFDDRQVVRDWAETRGYAGRRVTQTG
jgi:UDP-N-acetylmuramoyl-L-alanyl-D-glutamate--2,6-diaminopimelate ligase